MLKNDVKSTPNGFFAKNGKNQKKSTIFVPANSNIFFDMIDTSAFQGKTAAYFTLGCKLNFSETSTFGKLLHDMGVRTAQKGEQADICLINTCSVTEVADHKCRQAIHRMVRNHPNAFVVVTGCYAQLEAEAVAKIEGVDLVLGSDEKANLIQYLSDAWGGTVKDTPYYIKKTKDIKTFAPSCSRGNRTRYFLKVQDGCDYFCTYCTIPYARGFSRNPTIASLVAQAEQTAREGGKEIVLTGVNIGDFGKTTGEKLSDELIAYCAESRAFMPHFHIPLQSGSDTVLKLMHRHYDAQLFADKIHQIKALMPDAFIGVDVMVGCRGETPECFEETYRFLEALDVTQLHVFPYSERPGTSALSIPYVVNDKDKKLRSKRLLALSDEKTVAFYRRHIGQEAEVLFEKAPRGKAMHGFTRNYIRVELPAQQADPQLDNQLVKVTLGELTPKQDALRVYIK